MVNYEEALPKAVSYFNGEELPASVFLNKYAIKYPESNLYAETTPDEMHHRLAKAFFKAVKSSKTKHSIFRVEEDIYKLLEGFKYIIPQGSVMSQLGHPFQIGSISNCFVIGQPYDSYGGIFQKDQQQVQLMKRRGGVGIDISTLRPAQTSVSNAAGSSTGAVSFMHRFSNSTREVAQNGRRGALMLSMNIEHPESKEFAAIKQDLTQVTGANISLFLTDAFMEAVKNDQDYILRFPVNAPNMIEFQSVINSKGEEKNLWMDINNPSNLSNMMPENELIKVKVWNSEEYIYVKKVNAKSYWRSIVEYAHGTAEPGLMFLDRLINYSPDGIYDMYRGVTTNPCSEIFMQMYDACRLICINLLSTVKDPYTNKAMIDYDLLYDLVYKMQLLADTLVDLEIEKIQQIIEKIQNDPEPEEVKAVELDLWQKIQDVASKSRRTGTGFTALGDMLAAIGVKYDSDAGLEVIEKVAKVKFEAELQASIDLAKEHGPFFGWDAAKEASIAQVESSFYHMIKKEFPNQWKEMQLFGRRNVSWSTVAPTGTVSLMTQTTSGIEPLFAPYYFRKKKVNPNDAGVRVDEVDQNGDTWMQYPVMHPQFIEWYFTKMYTGERDMSLLESATKEDLEYYYSQSPWYDATAPTIDWKKRVEIQAIVQRYTTHSISSTINLPEDVSVEAVDEIYMHSWRQGLKGITVYRDNCRSNVLQTSAKKEHEEDIFVTRDAPVRPKCLPVDIYTTISKGTKWNVIVGLYNGNPYEVFAVPYFTTKEHAELCKITKGRYDLLIDGQTYSEDITSEMNDEEEVLTRMISTALRHGAEITFIVEQLNKSQGDITSFSKAISRTLKKYADKERLASVTTTCRECGSENVVFEEGCHNCKDCGASGCS